jgi:CHAT domain-containing protein
MWFPGRCRLPRCLWLIALLLFARHGALAQNGASPGSSLDAGLKAFQQGALEDAVATWEAAAESAQASGKLEEHVAALEYLSRAYTSLGRYRQAIESLHTALKLTEALPQTARIRLLAALGNAHVAVGPPEVAEKYLRQSLSLARSGSDVGSTAAALNDLGNLYSSQSKYGEATAAYAEGAALAQSVGLRLLAARALSNAVSGLLQQGKTREARTALQSASTEVRQTPDSHEAVLTRIRIAVGLRDLHARTADATGRLLLEASDGLCEAAAMAERLGDGRGASFAWGHLGALYEREQRFDEALQLTRKAIFLAQRIGAQESLYRWQWQAARLLRRVATMDEAIDSYRRAVHTLQSIRLEFATGYAQVAPFRDTVGRVYFELVDLLLQRAGSVDRPEDAASYLTEARDTVELFKLAELRDYFRDDCVDAALSTSKTLDAVSSTSAVIYPILLPDRTELLLSLPSGLKRFVLPVAAKSLTQEIRQLRLALENRTTREYLPHAQQLYRWLIGPLEAELTSNAIDTLVFVPDGPLRTIPMAALHDGERYLVQKYAVAITPGLTLTDPRPIDREAMKVLALGVTQAVQGFPPLPNVANELEMLRLLFGSTTLVDAAFSIPAFERELKQHSFTVLHIASHGEFGTDVKNTFLLTYNEHLTMDRLNQVLGLWRFRKEPLELLTLSACDTAAGDDRAALGLAGIAIKAGARSALATLWSINDVASTQLVEAFYRELKDPAVSRAGALRRAQMKMIADPHYDHPGFWSAFLLINNWL